MDRFTVFQTTAASQEIMGSIQLRAVEWGVFFSCDGKRTVTDLAGRFDLSVDTIRPVLLRLQEGGLIEEAAMPIEDYLARRGRSETSDAPMALQAFLEGPVSATVQVVQRKMRLGVVMSHIIGCSPSQTEGQLAVYRVFLRLPPDLLKQHGIRSLSLVDHSTQVEAGELTEAIERAVKQVLGRDLPDSVWE